MTNNVTPAETVAGLLAGGANEAAAIRSPGHPAMTFAGLRTAAWTMANALCARGIAQSDAIALLLPNGHEMAVTFLGTTLAAIAAPLNPAYTLEELDFYLGDLNAKAVIVLEGESGPILPAAAARHIPVIRLTARTLQFADALPNPKSLVPNPSSTFPTPDTPALILHTSGTTSRPKQVPLTHRNLAASAHAIAEVLQLGPHDVGLNLMPLFHIHGLIASLLAPMSAGGAVICTPGFNALKVMGWLNTERPTWYSAVPTMHQAILERAQRQPDAARAASLRFIRSSSASLPPQVFAALKDCFGCPVIEAYGMTEASHQMTSNPLPAGQQRPGSVGLPAGPEVQVASPEGRWLATGIEGEIVIRGPSVTGGYVSNPKANAEAFFDAGDGGGPWFRTGDLGVFDVEGYLTISGRLKELINRGGEKIAPREVDEVLLDHAAVAQAVTFAVPHAKLGEDVAAAVVLKEGAVATEDALRTYTAGRLAAFKVPRRIIILAEIPKGATGKVQRIGLAQKLGLG